MPRRVRIDGGGGGGEPTADAHIADTEDAHDASAISILDTGGYFVATQVEGALAETNSNLDDHEASPDGHPNYRQEADNHAHTASGLQAGTLDHGSALTGLTDDDHTQYVLTTELTGAAVALYQPDSPPASPHANDDEFENASLGVAWTEFDTGTVVTVSEGDYGLKLVNTNNSLDSVGGIYRTVPSGDWSLITKVSTSAFAADFHQGGIIIAEDLATNPTTADIYFLCFISRTLTHGEVRLIHYSAYNAFSSNVATFAVQGSSVYLRIRRASTTMSYDYSTDGLDWTQIASASEPFTISKVGLASNSSESVVDTAAYFRFWRQTALTTLDQPLLGQKLYSSLGTSGVVDHGALTGLGDDDHTGYRLESEDHTHASTGAQAGTVSHDALTSANKTTPALVSANGEHQSPGGVASIVSSVTDAGTVEVQLIGWAIPSGFLTIGSVLRLTAGGNISTDAAAGSGTYRCRFGTTTLLGTILATNGPNFLNNASGASIRFQVDVVFREVDSSSPVIAQLTRWNGGTLHTDITSTVPPVTSSTVDVAAGTLIELTFQASDAGTNAVWEYAYIEVVKM